MATRRISINVGGLWRTHVDLEEDATWGYLKLQIQIETGIWTGYQQLTPKIWGDNKCELEEGDEVMCEWENVSNYHPLHMAAIDENIRAIQLWIASTADINVININGVTPLMSACYKLKEKSVEELLQLGANIHCVDRNGNTALHHISMSWSFDLIKMKNIIKSLIIARYDPLTRNNTDKTFIDILRKHHSDEIATEIEELIKEISEKK